ncbi:3-methyl-2-oxobutanoate hydroxymethyltransferase [Calditrichota bacterium]
MSSSKKVKKVTVPSIIKMKKNGEKIAVLTAYDFLMAEMLDEAGIDIILVGDSMGMVIAGFKSTLPVTMDMMIHHASAVNRGVKRALLVADMPFLSFQKSDADTIGNAGSFLQEAGAEAVKIEGGELVAETIYKLVNYGIPVMAHLGLIPQSINKFGTYEVIGKDEITAKKILEEAKIIEEAGAFSVVLEKIPADLAKEISQTLKIPTIGIGAGKYCDGQVLVSHDMLGIFDKFNPKFVRRYAELGKEMRTAFVHYVDDVKKNKFPSDDESY